MLSMFSQFIFGSSNLFSGSQSSGSLPSWRDKNLCFDLRTTELELDHGEHLIACFFPIEDVKGNPDDFGVMKVTNLRLIWVCCDKKRVNLSIGWRTVSLAFEQNLKNSFGSTVTSLCILSKFESTKYEFVFNKMHTNDYFCNGVQLTESAFNKLRRFVQSDKTLTTGYLTPMVLVDPFEVVFNLWNLYKRTHLFRHCRSNLMDLFTANYMNQTTSKSPIRTEEINRLAGEEIIDVYGGIIQSETRLVKYSGSLILTNVRLIWVDEALLLRNLSIPYIRIESIKTRQGDKLVVNTYDYLATSNQIEFRTQRSNDLKRAKLIFEQVQNLTSLYKSKPKYGPESCEECIEVMQHLRPTENYIETSEGMTKLENFGPQINGKRDRLLVRAGGLDSSLTTTIATNTTTDNDIQSSTEGNESILMGDGSQGGEELTDYCTKLNTYLDERPIEHDQEVVYSEELGLAIERPINNQELERIWRIDI